MQVFGRVMPSWEASTRAIAILQLCSVEWEELDVHAPYDGDEVLPWETDIVLVKESLAPKLDVSSGGYRPGEC